MLLENSSGLEPHEHSISHTLHAERFKGMLGNRADMRLDYRFIAITFVLSVFFEPLFGACSHVNVNASLWKHTA